MSAHDASPPTVHSSAQVETGVMVGAGTLIWSGAHIRRGAHIGANCRIGDNAFIDVDVRVGDRCKILNNALLFQGTVLGDEVFIGPGACLTNDRHPRAASPEGTALTDGDWARRGVTVQRGCSVGAGAVVVAGVRLEMWCMVGAGAVVTRDVAAQSLVVGSPARHLAWVCRCAQRLTPNMNCTACGREYSIDGGRVIAGA